MQKTAYERRISDWSSDVCSSDLHAAGRLAEDQDPGREGQPSGKGDLLLVAAGQRPQIDVDARRPDAERVDMPPGDASLRLRLQEPARDAVEDADGDVLVDRLVMEQHRPSAFRHEGDAGAAGGGGAPQPDVPAVDGDAAPVRPQLAEQRAGELDLAAAHEAVDAQHLARPDLQRHVAVAAPDRKPLGGEDDRRAGPRRSEGHTSELPSIM